MEVRNFIAAECFQLARDKIPDEHIILAIRWQIWGREESESKSYSSCIPVSLVCWRTYCGSHFVKGEKTLFFHSFAAGKKFKVEKGDVSGAFLQGDDLKQELWCRPLKEMTDHLNVVECIHFRRDRTWNSSLGVMLHGPIGQMDLILLKVFLQEWVQQHFVRAMRQQWPQSTGLYRLCLQVAGVCRNQPWELWTLRDEVRWEDILRNSGGWMMPQNSRLVSWLLMQRIFLTNSKQLPL